MIVVPTEQVTPRDLAAFILSSDHANKFYFQQLKYHVQKWNAAVKCGEAYYLADRVVGMVRNVPKVYEAYLSRGWPANNADQRDAFARDVIVEAFKLLDSGAA